MKRARIKPGSTYSVPFGDGRLDMVCESVSPTGDCTFRYDFRNEEDGGFSVTVDCGKVRKPQL